jgi:hypothetical protein
MEDDVRANGWKLALMIASFVAALIAFAGVVEGWAWQDVLEAAIGTFAFIAAYLIWFFMFLERLTRY